MNPWYAVAQGGELVELVDARKRQSCAETLIEDAIYRVDETLTLCAAPGSARHHVFKEFQALALNPAHPDACYREALALIDEPGLDDPELHNLRDLPFVTIDNADSRDLDQALYLQRTPQGSRVVYALADAAYYIRPGSALFREALRRGVTYYAPGMAAPMLPVALSEGLVSLNPDVDRRALVFDISLDSEANTCSAAVYQARIRSRAKLSYDGVQQWLDQHNQGVAHAWDSEDFVQSLVLLQEVGERRIALARERNVVEHNRREAQMGLDAENAQKFSLRMRDRNDVERYNEQISLLCNMVGAQMMLRQQKLSEEMQAVFRVHLPPIEERLRRLHYALEGICDTHDLQGVWRWDGEQILADYLDALPKSGDRERLRHAIERQIMLINHASEFSAEPGPHHALGVDGYARFSSPMREIAGVFSHKELLEAQGQLAPQAVDQDEHLREQVIAAANNAKKIQRRLEKDFQLRIIEQYLHDDLRLELALRPVREATVMGMRGSRIYLAVDGFAIDLKIYAPDLEQHFGCKYSVGETAALADDPRAPQLRIGDAVKVRTGRWDAGRSRFVLDVVTE